MAQKPQVSSRDLCEIPTMPHVKKKTALRCVPTPYSRPLLLASRSSRCHLIVASRRLEMEMAGAHRSAVGNLSLLKAFSEGR